MDEKNCWTCEHFERVRIGAYCHGGKRTTKIPQKYWYSGSVKNCTSYKPKKDAEQKDELDEFMGKLEDAGILTGWKTFMRKDEQENRQ